MFSIFKRQGRKLPPAYTIVFRDNEQHIRISATYPYFVSLNYVKEDILSHNAFRGTHLSDWIFAEWRKYPDNTLLYQLPRFRRRSVTMIYVRPVPYSSSQRESEVIYDDRVYYGCPTAVLPEQMDDLRLRSVEVVSYE